MYRKGLAPCTGTVFAQDRRLARAARAGSRPLRGPKPCGAKVPQGLSFGDDPWRKLARNEAVSAGNPR